MPFSPEVKSEMFILCHRICCICLKRCGTNIEAAHIVDESAGGSNNQDNGIALCLDCHQEVGAYNDHHPRGNKFRPNELRARRDKVYQWIAEGKVPPMISVENRVHDGPNPIHRMIDLLIRYHTAYRRLHEAGSLEARREAIGEWRACHASVWGSSSVRDDVIRSLADPAKEVLSALRSPYVRLDDFDLIEQCASVLSEFAVSATPMSMPRTYSTEARSDHELWQQWQKDGEWWMFLGGMITRLRELAARAGAKWTCVTAAGST